MDEKNDALVNAENGTVPENPTTKQSDRKIAEDIVQIKEDVSYLRDLFIRRLNDDKQKNVMIQKLSEAASFSYIEPFLHEIILILDRLERRDDDFVRSVEEELYGIINRRGVEKIRVASEFDPAVHKAVKVTESCDTEKIQICGIVRNGYIFSGKVIRPAEVAVVKPKKD